MPESKTFGYARVSSKDQNEVRQRVELQDFGIHERDIFVDKLSGEDFERPQYQALRDQMLRKGDTLVIKSIDRFGRNYQEILEEWKHIVKDIGADIVVLDMPLLDTRQNKDLLGTLITDIILQLLSYVAEQERRNIRQRQREGIAIARSQGTKFGRSEKPYPPAWEDQYEKWQDGEITAVACYTGLGIPKSSFYDMVRRYREHIADQETQMLE
jgi:DNA invertase Pin-like site-specific DNA recombinase